MLSITDSVDNGASRLFKLIKVAGTGSTISKRNTILSKRLVQVSSLAIAGVGLMSMPANSFTVFGKSLSDNTSNNTATLNTVRKTATLNDTTTKQPYDQAFNHVITNRKLVLASVAGDSTYFGSDGFQHGFGYDLARSYANELGVNLKLQSYATVEDALSAVKNGEADMALTTASTQTKANFSVASINLSCGQDAKLTRNGLHPKVSWSFANPEDRLAKTASHYLCDNKQIKQTDKLANFYNQNLLKDAYNQMHFEKAMSERLPSYQSYFKSYAKKHNHDWQLLVAIGYQESHLKANAKSPTGVEGLMMLTVDTANEVGVKNRIDPNQSIHGGAKYLEKMKAKFAEVPRADRTWFALASYNMGPYAIREIQAKLREQGLNDKSWANVYAYMSDHASSNSRYVQCMHYVKNIRSYLESIKENDNRRDNYNMKNANGTETV